MTPEESLQVSIPAAEKRYPIYQQAGLLRDTGRILSQQLPAASKVLLISDETVFALYGQAVTQALSSAGMRVETAILPPGEPSKSLPQVERLYGQALALGLSRQDVVVALGGGVIGDLAGFVAATYMRGTRFVQIPTTLLAQVDSSVGGKVGVNFQALKNAIGAFYQPDLVLMDPQTLHSLPEREWRAGLAEVVKYALIENTCDPTADPQAFLQTLEQACLTAESADIRPVIRRCCELKARVVAADESESSGVRAFLNLGHTFAHAYEEITEYRHWRHGEAVAIGLIQACRLSNRLGLLPDAQTHRVQALLERLNLPQRPDITLEAERLLALMRHDKKAHAGSIRFVLPVDHIGRVELRGDVPDAEVLAVLKA